MKNLLSKITLIIAIIFYCSFLLPTKILYAYYDADNKAMIDFVYNLQALIIENNEAGLCVYGYDDIVASLIERYKDIKVIDSSNIKNAKHFCKLIYIGEDREKYIKSFIWELNKQKIVTISFIENFLEYDGMIYMKIGRRRIELLLNHQLVKDLNIKFNPIIFNIINN